MRQHVRPPRSRPSSGTLLTHRDGCFSTEFPLHRMTVPTSAFFILAYRAPFILASCTAIDVVSMPTSLADTRSLSAHNLFLDDATGAVRVLVNARARCAPHQCRYVHLRKPEPAITADHDTKLPARDQAAPAGLAPTRSRPLRI